jgi:putative DNA primase/helicase
MTDFTEKVGEFLKSSTIISQPGEPEVFEVENDITEEEIAKDRERRQREQQARQREYTIDLGIPLPDPIVPPVHLSWNCTDEGNGDRLLAQYGRDILYSVPERSWYIWDRHRWKKDETLKIRSLAKRVSRTIFIEASKAVYDDERTRLAKWADRSSMQERIKAMIESAAPLRAVTPDLFDIDPWLINCQNGTLDLRGGSLKNPDREDMLTKSMGVPFDRYADCPLWLTHLKRVFAGNLKYIKGFQEFLGYCLLQHNPEQIMAILHGSGKNGKSVTMGTIARVLGDYSVIIPADSLAVKRSDSPDTARSDLAALKGARLAWASEGEAGAILAEGMIKQMTGDDKIRVRRQYESGFEFTPGAKIVLVTNHEPRIKGTDNAIWRRIWLFPFTVTISDADRDPSMLDKLTAEGSGILNWLLDGLRRYLDAGKLSPPEEVIRATNRYRLDQDTLGQFIRDEMTISESGLITRSSFYNQYKIWCEAEGEKPLGSKRVSQYMRERGLSEFQSGGVRSWRGIRIKTHKERQEIEDTTDYQGVIT